MPTEAEMMADLQAADAAGDTQLAAHIAGLIKQARGPAPDDAFAAKVRAGGGSEGNPIMDFAAGMGKSITDLGLGVQQGLAAVGFGDKEALAREAADKEAIDKPLMNTGGGMAGKFGTDFAASMLPMGAVARGVGMLPKAASLFGRAAAGAAPAVGTGAAMGILDPSQNYDFEDKAGMGALWGLGGDVAARGVGRLIAPFRGKGSAAAQENAATLNAGGLPNQIPATQTDSPMLQAATNALEQIPVLGKAVTNAREGNLDWLTRKATARTGTEVPQLTPSARDAMTGRLNAEAEMFRHGLGPNTPGVPNVPMVPARRMAQTVGEVEQAADNVRQYAQATSQRSKVGKLDQAANTLAPPYGGVPGMRVVPHQSADTIMDLRRAAGELAYAEKDPVLAAQYRKLRDSYDDALKSTHADKGAEFDKWRQQWGAMEDVSNAFEKGTTGGRLTPENLASTLDDGFSPRGADAGYKRLVTAAAENMPTPPKGFNRAMYIAAILGGAPTAAGALSDVRRGEFGPGTAAGLTGSAALARALTRKAPSTETLDQIRKYLTAAAIAGGQ